MVRPPSVVAIRKSPVNISMTGINNNKSDIKIVDWLELSTRDLPAVTLNFQFVTKILRFQSSGSYLSEHIKDMRSSSFCIS